MSFITGDRVKETTTTTGTGAITLAGAVDSFRAFSVVASNLDTFHYAIVGQTGVEWEVGIGTWNTGGTITRVAGDVAAGSAGAATLVNFSVGTKDVFITFPATGTHFTDDVKLPSLNGGQLAGMRNHIINGDMRINQRVYVSAATLASGDYGHDRWKAGASGGDYSFTQLASSTVLTIVGGKSLIQVVEDSNVAGGTYQFSWEGTAVARVGVDTATPAGTFAVSPITLSSQTASTTCSIEFAGAAAVGTTSVVSATVGTLGKVQLEEGEIATSFERRPIGAELTLCQRYYEEVSSFNGSLHGTTSNLRGVSVQYKVTKRAIPTIVQSWTAGTEVAGSVTIYGFKARSTQADTTTLADLTSVTVDAEL